MRYISGGKDISQVTSRRQHDKRFNTVLLQSLNKTQKRTVGSVQSVIVRNKADAHDTINVYTRQPSLDKSISRLNSESFATSTNCKVSV